MSNRERKLILALGIMGIGGLLFAAYQLVIAPLEENRVQLAKLSEERSEKEEKLSTLRKDLKRLTIAKKRSLPSEPDVARREYEAMLTRLLRNAGIPPGYTIASKDNSDIRSIPLLAPKRPAYSRIGYSIRLNKVDLTSLTKFLQEYYHLNLLHQIVWFEVKRTVGGRTSSEQLDFAEECRAAGVAYGRGDRCAFAEWLTNAGFTAPPIPQD